MLILKIALWLGVGMVLSLFLAIVVGRRLKEQRVASEQQQQAAKPQHPTAIPVMRLDPKSPRVA